MTKLWVVDVGSTLVVRTEDYEGKEAATAAAQRAVAVINSWKKDLSDPRPLDSGSYPPGWDETCIPWGCPGDGRKAIGEILGENKNRKTRMKTEDGWNEVLVKLRYRDGALTPGGESRDEPETVQDLVEEIDRQMNASHFGGALELELVE